MSAAYLNPQIKFETATRQVHAEFDIRNEGPESWCPAEGFGIGHHLFDADSGTLLVDGRRVHPAHDVAPGESLHVALDFELPPEDGRYQVRLSPMRENVCWYYDQGWDFLALDAAVKNGVATLGRARVTEREAVRRRRELRGLGRAFVYPVLTVWRNRSLIRVMVRRDILGRYKGSFGGGLWTVMNPLLLMLTYFLVFGVIMYDRGHYASRADFALYFLAGMLPWIPFSEAVGRSTNVILENRNFVKKLVFAVETLPLNLVISAMVTELFAIGLYCVFLLLLRHGIPLTILWLPVLMIPQALFTAGVSWFLAGLGAFVRDLGQVIGFVLTAWFFMTPICYPEDKLPAIPLLTKNPMFMLVHSYRTVLLYHQPPAFGALWKFSLLAALVFVAGHAWFYKLRKSFADMI